MIKRNGFWLGTAILTGLLAASQPVPIIVVIGVALALAVLAAITPLAALMYMVVLAPMRTLIATEAGFQLPLDIGQMLLLVFLAFWPLHQIIVHRVPIRLKWSPIFALLALFLVLTGLTAFNAPSLSAWLSEWLKWVQILMLAVVVVASIRGTEWRWITFGLVAAGITNALIGLYEFLGGSGALHLLINDRFFRAFGTFGQPNPFGGFMGLLGPIALMAGLGYMLRWRRSRHAADFCWLIFYVTGFLVILAGVVMSWSRGGWLAFAIAAVVMLVALPRRLWQGIALGSLLAIGISVVWITGLLPASVSARIASSTEELFALEDVRGVDVTPENYPVLERLAHWQAALNMTRTSPWIGVGFGNYEAAYPSYRLINWDEPLGHAHNYYLNILAEGGIIGLLGYGKVWLSIMFLNWRARKHPDVLSRFVAIGLIGTWTYLGIHSLFDNLYVNNLFLHIGLMVGILGVLYNQVSRDVSLRSV